MLLVKGVPDVAKPKPEPMLIGFLRHLLGCEYTNNAGDFTCKYCIRKFWIFNISPCGQSARLLPFSLKERWLKESIHNCHLKSVFSLGWKSRYCFKALRRRDVVLSFSYLGRAGSFSGGLKYTIMELGNFLIQYHNGIALLLQSTSYWYLSIHGFI